ncbi:MAG TPA: hypothetical protein VHN19_01330 [Burkholderiales bacterium]|jgi:hypothetical protein|nr:hypothetical protein [Burkholderiales bacterium]
MNREQRRRGAKAKRRGHSQAPQVPPQVGPPAQKPGILLRMVASVLLSPWVLNKVKSPDVERMLANMAIQADRPEVAKSLLNRIAMRTDTPVKRG